MEGVQCRIGAAVEGVQSAGWGYQIEERDLGGLFFKCNSLLFVSCLAYQIMCKWRTLYLVTI